MGKIKALQVCSNAKRTEFLPCLDSNSSTLLNPNSLFVNSRILNLSTSLFSKVWKMRAPAIEVKFLGEKWQLRRLYFVDAAVHTCSKITKEPFCSFCGAVRCRGSSASLTSHRSRAQSPHGTRLHFHWAFFLFLVVTCCYAFLALYFSVPFLLPTPPPLSFPFFAFSFFSLLLLFFFLFRFLFVSFSFPFRFFRVRPRPFSFFSFRFSLVLFFSSLLSGLVSFFRSSLIWPLLSVFPVALRALRRAALTCTC